MLYGQTDKPQDETSPIFPISNGSRFITYYRASEVVEITGNEDTFLSYLKLKLTYEKKYSSFFRLGIFLDADIIEALSDKARLYEAFTSPALKLNRLSALLELGSAHELEMGMLPPLMKQFPMERLFLPLIYIMGRHPHVEEGKGWLPHAFVIGYRDVPLLEAELTDFYDTGIVYRWRWHLFRLGFGITNGEEGLDSNSAKTFSLLLGLESEGIKRDIFAPGSPDSKEQQHFFKIGLSGQIGNTASVPIKESRHQYKFYYYHRLGKIVWGAETLLFLHGLRDVDVLTRNFLVGKAELARQYGYREGFFDAFTTINDKNFFVPSWFQELHEDNYLLGSSSFLYLSVDEFLFSFWQVLLHISYHDANIFSDYNAIYSGKYRAFLRFQFELSQQIYLIISDTYTYDEVFIYSGQFYDRESRHNHPILDNDIFLGLSIGLF